MTKGFSIIFIVICFLFFVVVTVVSFLLLRENYYESSLATVINLELNKRDELFNLIQITTPKADQVIESPLVIKGKARGSWYFEASFPVKLLDNQGKILAQGIAQAQSDWMTENFVPFVATLTFTKPTSTAGTLILQKDNPSGLPEHDVQISIPLLFKQDSQVNTKPCIITGCSKQLCAEDEVVTTCEFKPEYVCYTKAVCERQADGKCSWTKTIDLEVCLNEFKE